MPAEPPESTVTEAGRTLEVRWIFPGRLEPALTGWFGRFPAQTESREDTYLLDPRLRGLSVKVRGGGALEVKVYRGSPGILEVAGRARGRLESWQKWSFPFSPPGPDRGERAGWRPVRKRRRISRFSRASGPLLARVPRPGQQPECSVELTEVRVNGQDWWSLGFERPAPPTCCAESSRPPPRLCSPRPCPAACNLAPMNPRPSRSGSASSRAPAMSPAPETVPPPRPLARRPGRHARHRPNGERARRHHRHRSQQHHRDHIEAAGPTLGCQKPARHLNCGNAPESAGAHDAQPFCGVQEHRAVRAPRPDRCAAPHQAQAPLDWADRAILAR